MPLSDLRLSLMTFPQRWGGAHLSLRFLLLPSGDPLQPLAAGAPMFAGTQLQLDAALIPSLENLPSPGAADTTQFAVNTPVPPDALTLYQQLFAAYNVGDQPRGAIPNVRVKKGLPQTYIEAFQFEQSRTPFALAGDEYGCAIRAQDPGKPNAPSSINWRHG